MSFQLGYKIRKIGKLVCFNINRKKLSLFISNFFVVELSRFQSRGEVKSRSKYNITFTKRFFFSPFSFAWYGHIWNDNKVCKLNYYISAIFKKKKIDKVSLLRIYIKTVKSGSALYGFGRIRKQTNMFVWKRN